MILTSLSSHIPLLHLEDVKRGIGYMKEKSYESQI